MSSHDPADSGSDTGEPELVTGALEALDGLDDRAVGEHLEAFERAHRELRTALDL